MTHVILSESRLSQLRTSPLSPVVCYRGSESQCGTRLEMMGRNGMRGSRRYSVVPVSEVPAGTIGR